MGWLEMKKKHKTVSSLAIRLHYRQEELVLSHCLSPSLVHQLHPDSYSAFPLRMLGRIRASPVEKNFFFL